MKKLIVSSLLMIVLVLNAIPVFAYSDVNAGQGGTNNGITAPAVDGFKEQKIIEVL